MSKQFDDDYKQMMQENIPDLWSRIEAGLKDRNTEEKIEEAQEITQESKPKTRHYPMRKGFGIVRKYATVIVAACLCIAVIIPVFLWGRGMSGNTQDTAASMALGSEEAAMVTEALESEQPVEEQSKIAGQDFTANDSMVTEESTMADSEMATEESATAEEPMGIMEESIEGEEFYETVIGNSGQKYVIDNLTYFRVDVTITSYKKLLKPYYEAEIISSSYDLPGSVSSIKLYAGDFEQTLSENQTYSLVIMDNMEPTDSRIHDYTILDQIAQ